MGLETATYISGLNASNPINATDVVGEGDDHIRLLKSTMLNTFPNITGAVTLTHTQLNNAAIKDENNVFTGFQSVVRSNSTMLRTQNTGAPANNQGWNFVIDTTTGHLKIMTATDAGADATLALELHRNTTTPDGMTLNSDAQVVGDLLVNGSVELNHAFPRVFFVESDATADNGLWDFMANGEQFLGRIRNDAESVTTTWLTVDRTTTNLDEVQLDVDLLDINGAVDMSSTLTLGGNLSSSGQIIQISHATPIFRLTETDQATDEKAFDIRVSGSSLRFRTLTDAYAAGSEFLVVDRTTTNVDLFTTEATKLYHKGQVYMESNLEDKISLYDDRLGGTTMYGFGVESGALYFKTPDIYRFYSAANADGGTSSFMDIDPPNIDFKSLSVQTDGDSADEVGYNGMPQNIQNGNYTLVLGDRGKCIYKASGGAGETITIPANSSVAFPIGTVIEIINQGGGDLSLAITTDTLTELGTGSTGTRTIGDDGSAVIRKVTSTSWVVSGVLIS